jgi:hypothetical protein
MLCHLSSVLALLFCFVLGLNFKSFSATQSRGFSSCHVIHLLAFFRMQVFSDDLLLLGGLSTTDKVSALRCK